MKFTEEKLPTPVFSKATRRSNEYYWRIQDIPAVIEAAAKVGLASLGGELCFFGKKGTSSEEVGTCECYWVEVIVNLPPDDKWGTIIMDSAKSALEQFQELPTKFDFHKEARQFPSVRAYENAGGNLEDIMYFGWSVVDEDDHRELLKNIKRTKEGPQPTE
jgi:hypothetical protein